LPRPSHGCGGGILHPVFFFSPFAKERMVASFRGDARGSRVTRAAPPSQSDTRDDIIVIIVVLRSRRRENDAVSHTVLWLRRDAKPNPSFGIVPLLSPNEASRRRRVVSYRGATHWHRCWNVLQAHPSIPSHHGTRPAAAATATAATAARALTCARPPPPLRLPPRTCPQRGFTALDWAKSEGCVAVLEVSAC